MFGSSLIILALLAQLPGADRPVSPSPSRQLAAAVPFVPGSTPAPLNREWIEAVNQVDGKVYRISGWHNADGSAQFDPREYPDFVCRTAPDGGPPPAPLTRPDFPIPQPSNQALPFPARGVARAKIPKPVAGQGWYGGNTIKPIEATGDGRKAHPPDVHLTAIGTPAEQTALLDRLRADPKFRALEASMGDRLAVQTYAPTDPMVARVGLVDGGHPDVVIQDSQGNDRFRRHADPGPATLVEEVRKVDPDYKPRRDETTPTGYSSTLLYCVVCAVVGAGGVLGLQRYFQRHP